jgi:hypothetical protein
MPSTRSSNKDANYKTFYKTKVPKQKYFPHRRKTVRRPDLAHDVRDKRQMTFLPEVMRRQETVQDSEDDGPDASTDVEENVEEGGVSTVDESAKTVNGGDKTTARKGKKRSSDVMQNTPEEDEEPVRPMLKRRRKVTAYKKRRTSSIIKHESENEQEHTFLPSKVEQAEGLKPRLRRQSTMTQIIDGRKPTPGGRDPEFRPAQRKPRTSWSAREKNDKDKRQRTLTQMVPGLMPMEIMSDEDMDLEDLQSEQRESQEYKDAFVRSLAEQGLFNPESNNGVHDKAARHDELTTHSHESVDDYEEDAPAITDHLMSNTADEHVGDDDYHPTQHIDAPIRKNPRTLRQTPSRGNPNPVVARYTTSSNSKSARSRFNLLSTPEKRKVFEIPSSQSPSNSPISTQVTPRRLGRSPLKPRSGNFTTTVETPSKRRKQVTFQELDKEQIPPPPTLRKFASVIQDSEDEDEAVSDDDGAADSQYDIGAETQALIRGIDQPLPGLDVGVETQVILRSIDRACASGLEDATLPDRESSEELGESVVDRGNKDFLGLGGQCNDVDKAQAPSIDDEFPQYSLAQHSNDVEHVDAVTRAGSAFSSSPPPHQTPQAIISSDDIDVDPASTSSPVLGEEPDPSTPSGERTQQHETFPSTPMIIGEDSSDEEAEPADTLPHPTSISRRHDLTELNQGAETLDEHLVQVPRSPFANPETQNSYTSKAEEQLHSEHQTYSQYRSKPQASSMYVAPDPGYSYQAPSFPLNPPIQHVQHSNHISQATTIDPTQLSQKTTPRKSRSQLVRNGTTTPHKIPSSTPFVSPERPPPLFIPSSFPSPGKVMAGWSSPLAGRSSPMDGKSPGLREKGNRITIAESQWGGEASWEDFSIPPPPPALEISDDEE